MLKDYRVGQNVKLKRAISKDLTTFYPKGTTFEIIREVWPDMWILKDPMGQNWEVTNLMLHDDFDIFEKPKAVPIPKSLVKWYEQLKAHNGN